MHTFELHDPSNVLSPSLLLGWTGIRSNLQRMLAIAGGPGRLRPHMKTHKTREITQLYLEHGVTRHKCATLREAQVLAECGVTDVLIAYPMVGPNQQRLCELAAKFPQTHFACLADDREMLQQLDQQAKANGVKLGLFVDFNVGQDRTGLVHEAPWLDELKQLSNLSLAGVHLYDGQNNSTKREERLARSLATLGRAFDVVSSMQTQTGNSLEIVLGGTPAFQVLADRIGDSYSQVSLSPGTCILHDAGYGQKYPELGFTPAAAVLTRCVSRPGPRLVTFDVGTKAIASDPPFGQRCVLLGLENAKTTLHNEEHLVVEAEEAEKWHPGMPNYAIPTHICPTVALYNHAHIVEDGQILKTIEIAARGR